MRENGLYAYVDYHLEGKTYDDGLIQITIHFYTKLAQELYQKIAAVKVGVDEETVDIALRQVAAEKQANPITEPNALIDGLKKIEETEWLDLQTSSELHAVDEIHKETIELDYDHAPQTEMSTANITLKDLPAEPSNFINLFHVVAWSIIENLQEDLADGYGLFTVSDSMEKSSARVTYSNDFLYVDSGQAMTDEAETIQDLLHDMKEQHAFTRLFEELTSLDYVRNYFSAPSIEMIYRDTGVVPLPQHWQELATEENLQFILDHLEVSYQLKDQTVTVKF
jgi:hypothetical protein